MMKNRFLCNVIPMKNRFMLLFARRISKHFALLTLEFTGTYINPNVRESSQVFEMNVEHQISLSNGNETFLCVF